MRKHGLLLAFVLAAALAGTGCLIPIVIPTTEFTSANTNGNASNRFTDVPAGAPSEDSEGGEGEAEREVVEPDVIRQDGNLLYILNQYRGLSIVDLDGNALLAQVATPGYPRDLYLAGGRAYVLVGYASDFIAEGNLIRSTISSRLYVVDVSDPSSAEVLSSFDLEGDLVDSRLVGDVLYAVSAQYQWYWWGEGDSGVVDGGVVFPAKQQTSESWVTSVDVSDPDNIGVVDTLSFAGYGSIIQASNQAIFVAAPDYGTGNTAITYIDINDPNGAISVRGGVSVRGLVGDQYKMDAYNGVLRVVSSTWWPDRHVYITTVDLSNPDVLEVLGEAPIEGAAGETLFATRFDGPRAYVVTYLIIDPLFVIDLSDPANPAVAGVLEVPGWSTHIIPQGDRLVALGVDDTNGRRVSVSLFDVADPASPGLLDRESFGQDWSWSSAYGDVKAFTVLEDAILVPFSGWTENGGFERLQFLSYTRDSLELEGHVDLRGTILRSLRHEDRFYAVTTETLAEIDASDRQTPAVSDTLVLAENVADIHEIRPGVLASVIARYDTGTVVVRMETNDGEILGETEVELPGLFATHANSDGVVLVATGWDSKGYYAVAHITVDGEGVPAVAFERRYDVEPYWGGYYYDFYRGGAAPPGAEVDAIARPGGPFWYPWYPWYTPEEASFLVGGFLVLRCYLENAPANIGSGQASQGLLIADLSAGGAAQVVGLGFSDIRSINAAGGKLYLSNFVGMGNDLAFRPVGAFYIREFDPATRQTGPAANVPGRFLQYDPVADLLLLEDVQYRGGFTVARSIESVRWDGAGPASALDSRVLPENAGTPHPGRSHLYFERWDNGFVLSGLTVGADGRFADAGEVKVTDSWGSFLGARGADAWVAVNGGAIARYRFDGPPALAGHTESMGSPSRIRFGAEDAYAALGFAGFIVLP